MEIVGLPDPGDPLWRGDGSRNPDRHIDQHDRRGQHRYGYGSAPTVTYSGGGGTISTLTAHLTGTQVSSITFTGGTGFTSVPTITVAAPGANSGQTVVGTCTMSATNTVTITSSDSTTSFASDAWDQVSGDKMGTIYLFDSTAAGSVNQTFSSKVAANTPMSAGGSSTITLAQAAPSTTFDSFLLTGSVNGGASVVWRRYALANTAIAHQQLNRFAWPQAYPNSNGDAATLTVAPQVYVVYSVSGTAPFKEVPVDFTFDPVAGTILTNLPTVFSNGTSANLAIGGSQTDGIPTDIRYFAAINKGILKAIEPPDSGGPTYTGTFDSETGVHRTLYVQVRGWRDPSNNANMLVFAQEMLDSVKNVVIEGNFTYMALCEAFLTPGITITFGNANYNNPWSGTAIPLTEPELAYATAPQALAYAMNLHVSTRRAHYTAAPFLHPSQTGVMLGFGGGFAGSFSAYGGGSGASYLDHAVDIGTPGVIGGPQGGGGDFGGFGGVDLSNPEIRRARERDRHPAAARGGDWVGGPQREASPAAQAQQAAALQQGQRFAEEQRKRQDATRQKALGNAPQANAMDPQAARIKRSADAAPRAAKSSSARLAWLALSTSRDSSLRGATTGAERGIEGGTEIEKAQGQRMAETRNAGVKQGDAIEQAKLDRLKKLRDNDPQNAGGGGG